MKDNFSSKSNEYAKYRPSYPQEFFKYLNSLLPDKGIIAWDCGTGNGQIAFELSKVFDQIYATDISSAQIGNAVQANNIEYSVQPAESTNFQDHQFDLIIVGQAVHWFDFEQFYKEVRRVVREKALICIVGYGRIRISKELDTIADDFYYNVIGQYWDKERKYIDENYETIPFPFEEFSAPEFVNILYWTKEHLTGYLNTWSAVKHFIRKNGYNPVDILSERIAEYWGENQEREVRFPVLLRMGKINK